MTNYKFLEKIAGLDFTWITRRLCTKKVENQEKCFETSGSLSISEIR